MGLRRTADKKNSTLFDNNSIKVILIGSFVIVSALIIMSFTSIMIMNKAVVAKLKTYDLKILAESISTAIEGKIDKAVDASLILANDPMMLHWIENKEQDEALSEQVRVKMKVMSEKLGYDTVFLVSNKTFHYWTYHDNTFELLDTVSEEDPSDAWYFQFLKNKHEYEINIDMNKELMDTYVFINTMMGDVNTPNAVTGLGMNLTQVINELIQNDKNSSVKNDIWLVDESGTIQLSKNKDFMNKNLKDILPNTIYTDIINVNNNDHEYYIKEYTTQNHSKYDIAYKKIRNTDWKIMIQIPRSESVKFLGDVAVNTLISCIIIILLMVITFYIVSNQIANPYKRALLLNQELESMVSNRTKELQEKNTQIQDSLDYAKRIQHTIFPSQTELQDNFKEHFILYEPKETVGGDFYWMRNYHDGKLLIIGDCTGHGVPGALMTTAVNAMLDHIADEICHDNPSVILNELDRLLKQSFGISREENFISDGLDAAVCFLSENGTVTYAGANIPMFFLEGEHVIEVKGNNLTIDCNVTKKEKKFENHIIEYKKSHIFYIASDGVKDQPGGEHKLPYGKRRLVSLLKSVAAYPLEEQKNRIQSEWKKYKGEEVRRDDITMIGFQL
ncbi:MAG: protein serine/threonine phosphatase [Herbinix sp.]|jgi:serine phosphatase RsbU (regulator of sigma subunit)|nr:protein serine/threonine phosphatase [Herbinix sp.]